MRVNIYAEEMTDRVELISKVIDGHTFTAVRFYLELPVTVGGGGQHRSQEGPQIIYEPMNGKPAQVAGPFIHSPGDDDSAAVTFWGKRDMRPLLRKALAILDDHYAVEHPEPFPDPACWDCGEVHAPGCPPREEARPEEPKVCTGTRSSRTEDADVCDDAACPKHGRPEGCIGPFGDAFDCPVHDPRKNQAPPAPPPPTPIEDHDFDDGGKVDAEYCWAHVSMFGRGDCGRPRSRHRSAHVAEPREKP